ncbi:MAG: CRISPR-associated helicase Cas3', partial [Anaerolineae bacterium]|nr:CRISPR-associated helicase Cas3' [Anaerolineae bacterium]
DAQKVYRCLQSEIGLAPETEIILLHGRFNGCDRRRKETEILQAVGVRSESRRRPFVVVATQVVEVSLDVDFDTIYTDPAPLEALLQRFGRVNRGRQEKMLCPVHVFEQPSLLDADKPRSYIPYNEELVRESLKVLRDDETIDESKVTEMLNQIYKGQIGANWQAEYDYQANLFEELLGKMRPFHSADHETVMAFYKLFDGVQVVPEDCLNDYYDALKDHLFLDASQYLVNISWGQYQQAKNKGLIRPPTSDKEFFDHILVPYDPEWGLDIYGALHQRDEEE